MAKGSRARGLREGGAVAALAWWAVTGSAAVRAQETIDRLLAVVGTQVILASDVAAARALKLVEVDDSADPPRQALALLVDRALVLAEVDRYSPPEPDEASVTREVLRVRSRFPTADAFAAALAASGLEETHLRERLRQDLRIAAYLDQRFVVTPPTDDEIEQLYRREPSRFTRDGTILPLDRVRPDVVRALVDERRAARVEEWIAGLRRRSQIAGY
jgi:hypothetical protein